MHGVGRNGRCRRPDTNTRSQEMKNRTSRIVVGIVCAALLLGAWHLAEAREWTVKKSDVPSRLN